MSEIIILRSDTDVSTKKGVFWDFDRNGKRQGLLYLDETPLPRHYDEDGKEECLVHFSAPRGTRNEMAF